LKIQNDDVEVGGANAAIMATTNAAARVLNLLRVSQLPILTQLVLEEALLRNTRQNWMLINDGAFQPAIVMGISGCVQALDSARPTQSLAAHFSLRFMTP
jgi:hypothetical protein